MREMNGEERFLSAIRCEEIDRMPSYWMMVEPAGLFRKELNAFRNKHPIEYLRQSWGKTPLGIIQARNWLSRGTSSFIPFPAGNIHFPVVYYNPTKDYFYTKDEAKQLKSRDKKFKISLWGEITQYGYKLGGKGFRKHDYWWYHKPFFSGPDALEKFDAFYSEFGAPWEQTMNPNTLTIKLGKWARKFMNKRGNPYAFLGMIQKHFEGIWGGFGPTTIARLVRKQPGKLRDICDKFEKVSILTEKCCLEAGFQILYTSDDLGQKERGLISPKIYEEFFLPALKNRCDLAHRHDAVMLMHSCGYFEEFLDLLLQAGLDGLQSLEVPAGNDLARIRTKVRDKMCLIGGLDSSRIMTFGTPDEIENHVKDQIKKATTLDGTTMNGGFIPGPSHDLLDTPLINVDRTIKSIENYGKYPLDWLKFYS